MTAPPAPRGQLWTLAGAPLLWLAHFVAVYSLATFVCAAPAAMPQPSFSVTAAGVAILTAGALALAAYAAVAHLQAWRNARNATGRDALRFLARTNLLLYALAAVGVLWVASPAFVLPPCV